MSHWGCWNDSEIAIDLNLIFKIGRILTCLVWLHNRPERGQLLLKTASVGDEQTSSWCHLSMTKDKSYYYLFWHWCHRREGKGAVPLLPRWCEGCNDERNDVRNSTKRHALKKSGKGQRKHCRELQTEGQVEKQPQAVIQRAALRTQNTRGVNETITWGPPWPVRS